MAACPHGMPTAAACVTCMEDGNVPVPPPESWRRASAAGGFTSRFDGQCVGCDLPITAGQRIIGWVRGDGSVYTHEWCAP